MGGVLTSLKNTVDLLTPQNAMENFPNQLYNGSLPFILFYSLEGINTSINTSNLLVNGGVFALAYVTSPSVSKYIPKMFKVLNSGVGNTYLLYNSIMALTAITSIVSPLTNSDPLNNPVDLGVNIINPFSSLPQDCIDKYGITPNKAVDWITWVKLAKDTQCVKNKQTLDALQKAMDQFGDYKPEPMWITYMFEELKVRKQVGPFTAYMLRPDNTKVKVNVPLITISSGMSDPDIIRLADVELAKAEGYKTGQEWLAIIFNSLMQTGTFGPSVVGVIDSQSLHAVHRTVNIPKLTFVLGKDDAIQLQSQLRSTLGV